MLVLSQLLKILKDNPEINTAAVEGLYKITVEEFERLPKKIQNGWVINKSINSAAIEMNYVDNWKDGEFGIPIFSIEDMYAGSHLLQNSMAQMGIIPTIAYDGNIFISNGIGNVDEEGRLMEKETRLMVRGVYKCVELMAKYAGLLD